MIVDEELLTAVRMQSRCELCGRYSRTGLDPHHLLARGMGGGGRLDVKENLIGLCRVCHQATHQSPAIREEAFAVVARREGLAPGQLREKLWKLQRSTP